MTTRMMLAIVGRAEDVASFSIGPLVVSVFGVAGTTGGTCGMASKIPEGPDRTRTACPVEVRVEIEPPCPRPTDWILPGAGVWWETSWRSGPIRREGGEMKVVDST